MFGGTQSYEEICGQVGPGFIGAQAPGNIPARRIGFPFPPSALQMTLQRIAEFPDQRFL